MPKRSLAERLDQAAQRKIRAEQLESRLKLMQRKEQARSIAELGALAAKAGLDRLPAPALYTCFRRIAAEAADPQLVTKWEQEGRQLLDKPAEQMAVVIARFSEKPQAELAEDMRRIGFRWNRILGQWEGRVPYEKATALVTAAGGTIATVEAA